MRPIILVILTLWIFNSHAQTRKVKVYKKRDYISGAFFQERKGRIEIENELIDIYFFQRRFQSPRHLPDTLINERYKDQIITLWRDPDGKIDFNVNWKYTYIYDSIGRVINYAYSSCVVCSNMGYNYSITYNSKGQLTLITDKNHQERFILYYDKRGDVSKFEEYSSESLVTEITLR